jgi:hypothetical protein
MAGVASKKKKPPLGVESGFVKKVKRYVVVSLLTLLRQNLHFSTLRTRSPTLRKSQYTSWTWVSPIKSEADVT